MELDLRIVHRPVLHDLGSAQGVPAVDHVDLGGELREESRLFHGGVAAADHGDLLAPEEEPIAGRAGGDAVPHQCPFGLDADQLGRGAG